MKAKLDTSNVQSVYHATSAAKALGNCQVCIYNLWSDLPFKLLNLVSNHVHPIGHVDLILTELIYGGLFQPCLGDCKKKKKQQHVSKYQLMQQGESSKLASFVHL